MIGVSPTENLQTLIDVANANGGARSGSAALT